MEIQSNKFSIPLAQEPKYQEGSFPSGLTRLCVEHAVSQRTTASLEHKQKEENEYTTEKKVIAVALVLGIIGILFIYPTVCIPAVSVAKTVIEDRTQSIQDWMAQIEGPTQSIQDWAASYDLTKTIRNMTPLRSIRPCALLASFYDPTSTIRDMTPLTSVRPSALPGAPYDPTSTIRDMSPFTSSRIPPTQ